mmetsp:Transcript_2230/g.5203  ORF Transcript_2230/g.5203 Transcript_2230/m.5203 type:complete len:261 (-) Transcript_2230:35-817(-)
MVRSLRNKPPGTYIGGNFIQPHRDIMYDACHDETTERPTSLSVWIPLNPSGATKSNGCMRVVPIEKDDFFYSPKHPRHSMNSNYKDVDNGSGEVDDYGGDDGGDGGDGDDDCVAEKLIVEQFGCGVWDPTCVHWGGSYEGSCSNNNDYDDDDGDDDDETTKGEFGVEPRSSLAFTVRLGGEAADFGTSASRIPGGSSSASSPSSSSAEEESGPMACSLEDCDKGGPRRRLQVVAKALLSYSHHWPGFPKDGLRENLGLSD